MPRPRPLSRSPLPFLLALLLALPAHAPVGQERLQGGETTVRVELVQVYATVVDRAGDPVTDLTAEDFEVQEGGRPMEIAVFEPPSPLAPQGEPAPLPERPPEPAAGESSPAPAVELAPERPAPGPEGRTYVAVFDGYNNPSGLRFRSAKEATIRFVDERFRPGDRMAVVELRPQARVLTDLTGDKERLKAALSRAAFLPGSGNQGLRALVDASITDTATRSGDRATLRLQNLARFNQMLESTGQRAFYDNLTAVGNGLARMPGRKYLLLYSGGFPFLTATNAVYGIQGAAPLQAYSDYFPSSFRTMLNQLARSNTAIYSLNIGDESFGADVEQSGNIRLSLARVGMDENLLEHMGLGNLFFGNDPFYTKQTLAVLAGETGGRFINVPDYDKALRSIDRELRAAYTLGYYPTDTRENGRFRKITVKVKGRPRLEVQHRAGYFAPKPYRAMNEDERQLHLADAAMGRLAKEELPLKVEIGYLPGSAGDTLAAVTLDVPLKSLTFQSGTEAQTYALDVVLLARDVAGQIVDSVSKVVRASLDPAKLPPPDGGLRLLESLTFPPGEAELQLVVRDQQQGTMTTRSARLEIPDFRYDRLALSSLHLMTRGGKFALVDEDFVPAGMRQRLMRQARAGDEPPPAPSVPNPFSLPDGSRFLPSSRRDFAAGEELLVFLQVLNLGHSEELGGPVLNVTFDLKPASGGGLRLPSRQEAVVIDGGQGRPTTVVYRLGLDGIEAGDYQLRATVLDKVSNAAVQAWEPITLVSTASAPVDAAGRR